MIVSNILIRFHAPDELGATSAPRTVSRLYARTFWIGFALLSSVTLYAILGVLLWNSLH